jgi:hypothetical protein
MGFLSLWVASTAISCTDRNTDLKKEVIVVPAASPAVVVKDPPSKPTSISVDKIGVNVETKKIDVNVNN